VGLASVTPPVGRGQQLGARHRVVRETTGLSRRGRRRRRGLPTLAVSRSATSVRACRVLPDFCATLNDSLEYAPRNEAASVCRQMIGTADDGAIEIGGDDAAFVARDARCGSGRGSSRRSANRTPALEALQQSGFAPLGRMLPTVPPGCSRRRRRRGAAVVARPRGVAPERLAALTEAAITKSVCRPGRSARFRHV
jgi:hypothetical protein